MRDKQVRTFLSAAKQRLIAGETLADSAGQSKRDGLYLDAMYLAGYCAECALKARLLAAIPAKDRLDFEGQYFRGPSGHDFGNLNALLLAAEIAIEERPATRLRKRIRGRRIKKAPIHLPVELAKRFRKIWS